MELCNVYFPLELVAKYFSSLKCSKTEGADRISSHILKRIGNCFLIQPIAMLFEMLMMYCYVPFDWKLSIITPIPKSGPSSNPANNRPISITCILYRLMELTTNVQMTAL